MGIIKRFLTGFLLTSSLLIGLCNADFIVNPFTGKMDYYEGFTSTFTSLSTSKIIARDVTGLQLVDKDDVLGIFIEDGGQVGVGTDSPTQALDVAGIVQGQQLYAEGNAPMLELKDAEPGNDDYRLYADGDGLRIDQYVNDTTWTNRLFFKGSNGYIGIGNLSTPSASLEILSTKAILKKSAATTFVHWRLENPSSTGKTGIELVRETDYKWQLKADGFTNDFRIRDEQNSVNPFIIEENTANNMLYLDSTGNIGVGTSVPTEKLDVIGAIQASTTVYADVVDCNDIYVSSIHAKSPDIGLNGYFNFYSTHVVSSPLPGYLWRDENGLLKYRKNSTETMEVSNYPANIVYVNTLDDLPAPNENFEIQLSGKTYDFNSNILISSYTIVLPSAASCDFKNFFYIYTGTKNVIKANLTAPVFQTLINGVIQAVESTSDVFDITASGAGTFSSFIVDTVGIDSLDGVNPSCNNIGVISNVIFAGRTLSFRNFLGNGLELRNIIKSDIQTMESDALTGITGNILFIASGTTSGVMQIKGYSAVIDTNQYAVNFNSNTVFSSGATYSDSVPEYEGSATKDNIFYPGSYNNTSIGFKFSGNKDIPDSAVSAEIEVINQITIDNPATSAHMLISTNTWVSTALERVEINGGSNENIKYIGLEDITLYLETICNIQPSLGAAKNFTISLYNICSISKTVTFDNTTDTVTRANHGLSDGDTLHFDNTGGALPTGLRSDIVYYSTTTTTNTFQIAYTSGGSPIDFTSDGSGTNFYFDTTRIGKTPTTINTSSAIDMRAVAQSVFETNEKIGVVITNDSDSTTDILVNRTYLLVR